MFFLFSVIIFVVGIYITIYIDGLLLYLSTTFQKFDIIVLTETELIYDLNKYYIIMENSRNVSD